MEKRQKKGTGKRQLPAPGSMAQGPAAGEVNKTGFMDRPSELLVDWILGMRERQPKVPGVFWPSYGEKTELRLTETAELWMRQGWAGEWRPVSGPCLCGAVGQRCRVWSRWQFGL